uniref:PRKCA-binding protein-like n=1 Tax=Monopterus albus TaxID=43700 RepID=UPI0009B4ABEF|nr:PRKCA-binding protein-like [Monopterus albus]
MEHTKMLLRAFFELSQTHRAFGDVFSVIGVREPQAAASEAFVKFADAHRSIEKYGIKLLKTIKPVSSDSDWSIYHTESAQRQKRGCLCSAYFY